MTLQDPELQRYMHQQRLGEWISSLAQGFLQAAAGGQGLGTGLLQGLASARAQPSGGMDLLRTQAALESLTASREERERKKEMEEKWKDVLGLTGPTDLLASAAPGFATGRGAGPFADIPREIREMAVYDEPLRRSLAGRYFGGEETYAAPTTVVGPDGKPMLVRFPKGAGEPMPVEGYSPYVKPKEPTERESKIQELMSRGLSEQQAQDVASGRVRAIADPVTGAIKFVNVASGTVTEPKGQPALPKATRAEMATQMKSIDTLLTKMPSVQEAVEKGVGLLPAAKELGGKILGQLPTGSVEIPGIGEVGTGEAAVDPEVVRARMQLRIFREDMIEAFRKSGRVPVQEQQRLLQFADKLGAINSVPDARLAFQQLETELKRIRDTYEVQLGAETPGATVGAPNIESMSLEQLNSLDPGTMGEDDLLRASRRYRELVQ